MASFSSLPEADGKGGRKGIIYFLVLPNAISILRVSSLHPIQSPTLVWLTIASTLAQLQEVVTDPVYNAWERLRTAELSVSGFCKFYESFQSSWFLASLFPSS